MSFPRYSAYRDSGVEWLGQIPSHWAVKRLRFVAELNPSKSEVSHLAADTEVSFLPMEAIGEDGSLELDRVRPLADVQTGYTFFRDGDVTIAKITPCFENGKGAAMRDLCNGIGFGTTELIVTRPKAMQTTSTYLHWLFTSRPFRKAGEAFMYGAGGQKRVPDDFVRDFAIGFPPLPEQRHIVTFLGREAAKIDALVEEQRRLIELLKEKRQAVISQAVTKGLNPNVPMKDSGVAWLGKVPAHWEVKTIRHIIDAIGDVDHFMPQSVDKGVPYLMTGDLKDLVSEVRLEDCKQVSDSDYLQLSKKIKTAKGDVVMARYATIGTTMYVDLDLEVLVSYSCVTLKTSHRKMSGMYLFQYMKSDAFRQGVEHRVNTNTQGNVGIGDLQTLKVAVPPLDEQAAITAVLGSESLKMGSLIAESERAVSLLNERRAALISAAVTGKIDVRGLVPQPVAAAA